MPRWRSHSISAGTSFRAAAELGFEIMATVLMVGIKQKLLVPFGAGNGAFHHRGLESDFLHGPVHPFASRPMQQRIANDAALTHLALAHFELRFDQYNHLAVGTEQRLNRRQDQRDRKSTRLNS